MAKTVVYCLIENGELLLGLHDGKRTTQHRVTIDRDLIEFLTGAMVEARAEFEERMEAERQLSKSA